MKFGFIELTRGENNSPRPQCVVCGDVLSNESMKPAKLIRHLKTKHPEIETKPIDFFQRKKLKFKIQKNSFTDSFSVDKSLVKASYLVALRVAKCKKPYTIAEDLILFN